MHLPIIISRLSNFLFFFKETNGHNLIEFDLRKHLSDENLDPSFYGRSGNEIWKQIKKSIGKQNTKQFQKAITSLEPIFTPHWHKASERLLLWNKYFQNNQLLFQQIISDIKKLSGVERFNAYKIPIYLISDHINRDKEINAWFSWTPRASFIVVEIPSGLKVPNSFFPLSILAHEFFHLILRKNKNLLSAIIKITKENEKLLAKLSGGIPNRIFLEELLISSFIPEGYLSEKYFNTKVANHISKPNNLLGRRKFIALKLYQTAKNYINDTRRIDEKYLRDLIGVIKKSAK